MKNEKVLVIGANGTVGTELVKLLKAQGVEVKATTSKAVYVKDGVEYAHVDLGKG
ncbi:MAG: sugar nucleotide-binding protein [Bdellovibrionota bacterium]